MSDFSEAMEHIGKVGCDEVITTHQGGTIPFESAIEEYGIDVELIFIGRREGKVFTLGACRTMLSTILGLKLWGEWDGVLVKGLDEPMLFSEFMELGNDKLKAILPATFNPGKKVDHGSYYKKGKVR